MNNLIFYFFYNLTHQYLWLDSVIWFLAVPFIYIMISIVLVYLFIHYKFFNIKNTIEKVRMHGKEVFIIFFSTGLAYAIAHVLKMIIHTDRPFVSLANVQPLFFESDFAFPSGHSATIAALAFAVFFKHKRLGYICIIAALLIGIARIASGVHFPVDIIGGYAIGFLVAFLLKSR